MVAPMLLYALGAPIHMGCVLTSAYLAARALHERFELGGDAEAVVYAGTGR